MTLLTLPANRSPISVSLPNDSVHHAREQLASGTIIAQHDYLRAVANHWKVLFKGTSQLLNGNGIPSNRLVDRGQLRRERKPQPYAKVEVQQA